VLQGIRGVNRTVGQAQPWRRGGGEGKKRAEAAVEKDAEVKRFLERALAERGIDLESWEFGLRAAVLCAGARLLEEMLAGIGSGRRSEPVACSCGRQMRSKGLRKKRIKTVLGDITFRRSLFVCPQCGASRFPGDELLDVVGTIFSPGIRRLMARAGQRDTFKEGRDDLFEFAVIRVTAKDVERVAERTGEAVESWHRQKREVLFRCNGSAEEPAECPPVLYICYDGTGVPMVPWETAGRKGKQPDGTSRTREVKLGCVFTQTAVDEQGRPVRDNASTTFVGAIENSEAFGQRIYVEAVRRGLEDAGKVVIIADGARYNWEIAAMHFPGAVQIVDLYHARQHLHTLSTLLWPRGGEEIKALEEKLRALLDEGKLEEIVETAKTYMPKRGSRRKAILKELGYFHNNASRMRYGQYRAQGLFVGSGVVEAGCKTIVGKRLKQSGMQWTVRGANAIIALRCCHLSARMEEFYEQQAA
jgi:hypothetical protein